MKTTTVECCVATLLLVIPISSAWAGTEGTESTFYGHNAGLVNSDDANENTFIGAGAGHDNTTGYENTYLGRQAGFSNIDGHSGTFLGWFAGHANTSGSDNTFVGNLAGTAVTTGFLNVLIGSNAGHGLTTGGENTMLGMNAGYNNTSGSGNVFVGFGAGFDESGSQKLYIDNCTEGGTCTSPLIYGEFDNHLLKVNGMLNVRANGVAKSQMHFSKDDTDTGGWITSVLDNNFFLSSGASFDATAGNWTQHSPDNSAVIAGSGSLGYRIFTNTGNTVNGSFTPTVRLHIDYNGNLGLNQAAVAGTPIQHSSGAHLTSGGVWTDASSREYKEHVRPLTSEEAMQAVTGLTPVRYNYSADAQEEHVGFIAEDVPPLVATPDRKSLSPMDIVAVLTKVVQEQKQTLDEKVKLIMRQQQTLESVVSELVKLRADVAQIKNRTD